MNAPFFSLERFQEKKKTRNWTKTSKNTIEASFWLCYHSVSVIKLNMAQTNIFWIRKVLSWFENCHHSDYVICFIQSLSDHIKRLWLFSINFFSFFPLSQMFHKKWGLILLVWFENFICPSQNILHPKMLFFSWKKLKTSVSSFIKHWGLDSLKHESRMKWDQDFWRFVTTVGAA
jgi:hypothetical protein